MIYIVQQFYNGKWWHSSFHIQRYYAEEILKFLTESTDGSYRIKEFEIPEDE